MERGNRFRRNCLFQTHNFLFCFGGSHLSIPAPTHQPTWPMAPPPVIEEDTRVDGFAREASEHCASTVSRSDAMYATCNAYSAIVTDGCATYLNGAYSLHGGGRSSFLRGI